MVETLIETLELENNLTLKIFDGSKQIAGDRWMIALIARLAVPVDPLAAQIHEIEWDRIKAALGAEVVFEQKRERNFIGAEAKEAVFESLCANFKATQVPYLAHPEFAKRFILSRYSAHLHTTGQA